MNYEFKNGSYIYTIPTGTKPVRFVSEPPLLISEEEFRERFLNLINNVSVMNGANKNE